MDADTRLRVWERAGDCCEYCRLPQAAQPLARFHVEHIIARQHGGADELSNLALACLHCNLHKGPNIAGIDPDTGQLVPLFHPRLDEWTSHFRPVGTLIEGLTPIGRATIRVLAMNSRAQRDARSE